MSVLDEIVKAYDIRGTVPDQLNAEVAHAARRRLRPLLPMPPRCSSAATCARPGRSWSTRSPTGVQSQGVDVVDLGLASTDLVYFAAGQPRPARVRCSRRRTTRPSTTASSSACRRPAGRRRRARRDQGGRRTPCSTATARCRRRARRVGAPSSDLLDGVRRPRRVVRRRRRRCARCASSPTRPTAWAASSCRRCSSGSPPIELEVMYGELDGTFPNHPADPLQPANQTRPAGPGRRRRVRPRAGLRR